MNFNVQLTLNPVTVEHCRHTTFIQSNPVVPRQQILTMVSKFWLVCFHHNQKGEMQIEFCTCSSCRHSVHRNAKMKTSMRKKFGTNTCNITTHNSQHVQSACSKDSGSMLLCFVEMPVFSCHFWPFYKQKCLIFQRKRNPN